MAGVTVESDILNYLSKSKTPRSIEDISEKTGWSLATTYKKVGILRKQGKIAVVARRPTDGRPANLWGVVR